jgi:hypothetical protein
MTITRKATTNTERNRSKKDCGAACHARVRASGTVVQKREPMELKMPVGDTNQWWSVSKAGIVS